MEIAKEKWFEVKYDTKLDKMVIKKPKFNNKMLLKHIINKRFATETQKKIRQFKIKKEKQELDEKH